MCLRCGPRAPLHIEERPAAMILVPATNAPEQGWSMQNGQRQEQGGLSNWADRSRERLRAASPFNLRPAGRNRPRRSIVRPGMIACGFDGAELGRVDRVSSQQRVLHVADGSGTLVLPMTLVGLIGRDFIMLRGTAADLRAAYTAAPAAGGAPPQRVRSARAAS